MPAPEDHSYLKVCAQLASLLSISISSARKKVELAAAKEGIKDIASRRIIAEKLLEEIIQNNHNDDSNVAAQFDELLSALAHEENFMIED